MPPPGGKRNSLSQVVAWLTSKAKSTQGAKPNNAADKPVDVNQFKDAFQPDDGVFSPNLPLPPQDVQETRVWDFPSAYNTTWTPRAWEPISFRELRFLAENHNIMRLCIETRKDQIESVPWQIRPKDKENAAADADERAETLTEFWEKPDRINPFAAWVRGWIEETLVTDAAAFEIRRNRGGAILGLDQIDGSTLKVLIDHTGRIPQPPVPAYEQVIKGRPWVLLEDGGRVNTGDAGNSQFSSNQLLYLPRNKRVHRVYGYSPVEQIILTANMALRRQLRQLATFTEGNVPVGMATAPAGWTPEQTATWQAQLNAMLGGNDAERSRMIWGPAGATWIPLQEPPTKTEFDEWLARIVCYTFSLPPSAFTPQVNRATAQTAQEVGLEEGLAPILAYVKRGVDHVIQNLQGHPDLEFAWVSIRELDPKTQADIETELVGGGLKTRNEARDTLGLQPIDGGDEMTINTGTGPVLLSNVINPPPPDGAEPSGAGNASSGAPGKDAEKPDKGNSAPTGTKVSRKAAAKTLYVNRPLKNTTDLRSWAKAQGFKSTLKPKDLHVTIAFSRDLVDWDEVGDTFDEICVPESDTRIVEALGDKGAVVLKFTSTELAQRWQQIRDAGASWDFPSYKPHISITYNGAPSDLSAVEPFAGELIFGPEKFAELDEDWDQTIEEREVPK